MIWYGDESKHLGLLVRGRVVTNCGLSLPPGAAARVTETPPGDEICQLCATGQVVHVPDADSGPGRPLARTVALLGAIRDALRGSGWVNVAMALSWLALLVLAIYVYVAWPR